MLAAASRFPPLGGGFRGASSGARLSWPLSATWLVTSSCTLAERGTISTEPALINMRGGIAFTLRRSDSFMPTRRAASDTLIVEGALHAVQLAYCPAL